MVIGEGRLGLAAGHGHLAAQVPGRGRPRRHPHRLPGQAVGVLEEAEFHVHPPAVDRQPHVAGRKLQGLGDLPDGLHPLAAFPEHVGVVPAGIDVERAALDRALQQALGPHQVVTVHRRQALVAQPAGVGEFRRHGIAPLHEPASGRERRGEDQDEGRTQRHGSARPHGWIGGNVASRPDRRHTDRRSPVCRNCRIARPGRDRPCRGRQPSHTTRRRSARTARSRH